MARLPASGPTSLPVVQQPRNPQSESIARSPYETAFEQQRAAGVGRALVVRRQFGLEKVELIVGERRPAGAGKNQRAGGPSRVVEQRLVPRAGRVVDVERDRRR